MSSSFLIILDYLFLRQNTRAVRRAPSHVLRQAEASGAAFSRTALVCPESVPCVRSPTLSHDKRETRGSRWEAPGHGPHPGKCAPAGAFPRSRLSGTNDSVLPAWWGLRGTPRRHGTFAGQAMGRDSGKALSAHVAESGSGVGAGVPVMHPWEMLHIELGHLETRREHRFAEQRTSETTDAQPVKRTPLRLKFQVQNV